MSNMRQISGIELIAKWRGALRLLRLTFSIALLTATVSMAASANEATYVRAEIYYISWELMPRTRLTLEGIRNSHYLKTTVNNDFEVKHLIENWLKLDKLKSISSPEHEDPRLVVDLFDNKGNRATYYASFASLISENGRMKRSIDETFRNKFRFSR